MATASQGPRLKSTSTGKIRELEEQLVELANQQHQSGDFQRLFNARFTLKGAQEYFLQQSLFALNRRDCWGFVQGAAPMPVKKLVWEHEEDELVGNRERKIEDHYTLAVKQGEAIGLYPEDFKNVQPMDTCFASFQAWINVARTSHWLAAAAASSVLELDNSDEVVATGCISRRVGEKLRDELGIPMHKQYSNAEHMEADVEHGRLIITLVRQYGDSEENRQRILRGAKMSLAIERAFRGFTATILERHAS